MNSFLARAALVIVSTTSVLIGTAQAVVLPRCTAPAYAGAATIKAMNSNLAWAYHQVMMVNESENGRLAYCLSRSGMEESGLSFGVSQLDLRTNSRAWPVLVRMLQEAGEVQASLRFDDADISYLQSQLVGLRAPRAKDLMVLNDPRLDTLLMRVNEGLKQESSRQAIDAIHAEHVKDVVDFIEHTQSDLRASTVGSSQLLESSLASKLLVMDYRNLFGSIDGKMKPFLMTGRAAMTDGPLKIQGDKLAVSDIMRFILETKQGRGCRSYQRAEMLRRMGYVVTIARANGDKTSWTQEDQSYFSQALPIILENACVSRKVDLGHLHALTKTAL